MRQQTPPTRLSRSRPHCGRRLPGFLLGTWLTLLAALGVPAGAAPLSDLSFSEGGGLTTTNAGSLGGLGTLARQNGFPIFVDKVPAGPYAPSSNGSAVDFGSIGVGDGGRAIDYPGALGGLSGFTVCGWVNCRDLTVGPGGNRIVFALDAPNGRGFDLVQLADGSLRLGVNQWPDGADGGGPRSSAGWITADPDTGVANWVFFAVTYDGTLASGQASFYFGTADMLAMLDFSPYDYNRGTLTNSGTVTIGNFGTVAGVRNDTGSTGSRCFRGLLDEIKVFPEVLTLEQIQAAQVSAALPPPPLAFFSEPVDQTVLAGNAATFNVMVQGGFPISYQWQRGNVNIPGATEPSYTVVSPMPADDGAQFRVIVTNPLGQLTSSNATLHVTLDTTPPTVVAVETKRNLTTLRVIFSEPMDASTAENSLNFKLLFGAQELTTQSAVLQANLTEVLLTTDPMTPGEPHKLRIANVRDQAIPPNTMAAVEVEFTSYNPPPRTEPLLEVRFEEGLGNSVANTGNAGGTGTIDSGLASSAAGLPAFVNNVPLGPNAPAGNLWSLSTGSGAGHAQYAGQAVDFPYDVKSRTVGLEQFTVCGWINVTDGTIGGGGNRIICTWGWDAGGVQNNRLTGLDVVVVANGQMRLGVNQAPDYPNPPGNIGPTSSEGKVPISATADPANWVFFAVTYDATLDAENAKFYFGDGNSLAVQDTDATLVDYQRGPVLDASVPRDLTLANFVSGNSPNDGSGRDSTSNSRAFRGLMDEIRLFENALTLEEIQQIQTRAGAIITAPAGIVTHPVSQSVFAGQPAVFSVIATGTPPIAVQWQRNGQDIPGATSPIYTLPSATAADNGAVFRATVANSHGSQTSSAATLAVWPEDGLKLRFVLEEGAGLTTTNLGNLRGYGTFAQQADYPLFSSNVPVGPYAPTASVNSVDFGTIAAGQGGRAIDWGNGLTPTLGGMQGFTVCGWVNPRDLTIGPGGNRLVFALETSNGRGFDLVHLADGSLRLGVNQWPDGSGGGGPISSPGKLTADPDAAAANWVFFAVTYDSSLETEQVRYWFGTPEIPVALDVARDYLNRGAIVATGPATLGNFGTVVGAVRTATENNSRVFRGLMDDIQVHNRVLTLQEIGRLQMGLPLGVAAPTLAISREGDQVVITWTSEAPFQLVYRNQLLVGDWTPVSESVETVGNLHTVRVNANQPTRFYRLQP